MHQSPAAPSSPEPQRRLRRVFIEDRQRKTLEHARDHLGYADDVDPNAHDRATFRLINQRKQLDDLPGADFVVPALDNWKHWTKMSDWDSRNGLLEELTGKLRRREASAGEVTFLVTVCRPTWAAVAANLRTYGGLDTDPGAEGFRKREEARRVNQLDRAELDQVIHHALLDALVACPRPFPRRFFPWLKTTLAYRALDHVRQDLGEHDSTLPHDDGIKDVLDEILGNPQHPGAAFFTAPASPAYSQWLRTLDVPQIFDVAGEYATYNRTRSACERAVDRLPDRQRSVIRDRYYRAMTQVEIAERQGLSASSIRNTHGQAIGNLRRDDELFEVLAAVGKVRDRARRAKLEAERPAAA
jgi:RNA polymerase sigma factor (sigma-70 family)